jgi:peroxiredoxin Q/BCP
VSHPIERRRPAVKRVISRRSFATALLAATSLACAGHAELKVGDKAPEFVLPGSDGRTYTLSEFKDETAVVIAWFPMAFTGG